MHGRDLLVRPVVAPLNASAGTVAAAPQLSVWLPPCRTGWVAWSDGGLLQTSGSGALVRVSSAWDQLPMFVRGGAVLPLLPRGSLDARTSDAVNWALFLGGATAGNGSRYLDEGDSTA